MKTLVAFTGTLAIGGHRRSHTRAEAEADNEHFDGKTTD